MTSSTLDEIEDGASVFIDANIFIYHFTATSLACRRLLESCEGGRLTGFTSVTALAEVGHRLMTLEAVAKGLVSSGNVVRKLRDKPEVIKQLHDYQDQLDQISGMGITIFPLDGEILTIANGLRRRDGLLLNDSVLAATAIYWLIPNLASADRDFERVPELRLFCPSDL